MRRDWGKAVLTRGNPKDYITAFTEVDSLLATSIQVEFCDTTSTFTWVTFLTTFYNTDDMWGCVNFMCICTKVDRTINSESLYMYAILILFLKMGESLVTNAMLW